ncbi:hypothetical protein BGZ68_010570 [Mortierella alpina]|nr:hypothetical protein BGZ68_010570 [Mortierella alpina]
MSSFIPATPLAENECTDAHVHLTSDRDILDNSSSSVSDAYESSQEDLGCEESLYDHYDIQLKPRQTHKPKVSNPKQRPETKIVQPILRTSRKQYSFPVDVLERVCSHLSQATLRHAISLVCKEWSIISKRFIQRAGAWDYSTTLDEERQLLERMPMLSTLECCLGNVRGNFGGYNPVLMGQVFCASWDRFRTAITAPVSASDRDQHTNSTEPTCLLHHIRRLVLKRSSMTYEFTMLQLLGHLQFLQSLEIHANGTQIPLFELLDNCPSLTELKVEGGKYLSTCLLMGDDEDLILEASVSPPHSTAHLHEDFSSIVPVKSYSGRYKLRVFDIHTVNVKQRVLEHFIATCPELRVFKLHEINGRIWVPELSIHRPDPIDEERLWNHLQKCCPHLHWYHILPLANLNDDRMEALKRMRQSKTLGHFLTTACTLKWHDQLQDLNVRRLLGNVTVLEIRPLTTVITHQRMTESLQKLLCLMPNLLHLIASDVSFVATDVLVVPGRGRPAHLQNRLNYHNRGRKRQERKEKGQQRQKALERFQVPIQDRLTPVPDVWQCRDLRTMALSLSSSPQVFSFFWEYVAAHRLLRNLTSLSIQLGELRVGQVKEKPTAAMPLPERCENDFLLLRGLRCLEVLDIKARSIQGMIQATDFEFLRRHDPSQVIFIIPAKNKDAGSDLDEDSTRNRHGRRKDRTFWPHLQSLHIRSGYIQAKTDFAPVVAGIERIRPGVEFVIRQGL